MNIEYEKSFAYHIEVELGGPLEKYWDFEKNTVNPYHVSRSSKNKAWIKCTDVDYHETYETSRDNFVKGSRCPYCSSQKIHPKDSFAQYHIDNTDHNFLEKYWDYKKNTVNPWEISKKNKKRIWIKCQEKDYHGSYETCSSHFTSGKRCGCCTMRPGKVHPRDSFAQYHIDNTDKDFLEKYWDYEKNTIDPWEIPRNSHKKVWIKCNNLEVNKSNGLMKKDYHESNIMSCLNFTCGNRCLACNSKGKKSNIHPYDSFGYHNFDKTQSWHPDNDISPFRISLNTHKKYKFTCHECGNEWNIMISNIGKGRWCPVCASSQGEKKILEFLDNNDIKYLYDKVYFLDLKGVSDLLRPDFILPEHKIWIEYDGEFHFKDIRKDGSLVKQKYHDKLKNEYAKKHGWKMIRIPYWEFDNIENILKREISRVWI